MNVPPAHGLEIQVKEIEETNVSRTTSNVLDSLKSNLDKLEDLHSRLQFMLGEIKGLVRK